MSEKIKIKVLECIRQGKIGGGESHLLSLAENIDRNIFEPIILSFTDGPMIDKLKEMGIQTHIIHSEKPFDFRVRKNILSLLKEEKIDLIHTHGTRATSNLIGPSKKLKIPIVYTIHGWSFHDDQKPLVKKIRVLSEKYLTSKTDVNIAVSQSNLLSGIKVIPKLKGIVINNGIDQQKFNKQRELKNIREELDIPASGILLIFIARFTSHKQPLSLIKSFAEALKINPLLKLLMVGEGDEKDTALAMVKEMNIEKDIFFLPFRQDVPDLLASADIFILPSLWEGLPIGLLEAMSMGKAVIATNVDGTSEIVKNNENGLLIEVDDLVKNLTNAIQNLSADKELRNRLSLNALQTVNEKFNAGAMTTAIENVYKKIIFK
ncbi:MAG: glycosyltransferase family 4 protein [Ferruginibacter sp.]